VNNALAEKSAFLTAISRCPFLGKLTDATTTSTSTIGDSGETWLANEFVGSNVEITSGTGAGQSRKVVANSSNTLTVTPEWTVTPDTTSDFEIAPEQLYGSTNTVTAIAMTDTDFLGAGRKLYVGTSNGSDGGGVSVFYGGFNSAITDIYHADDGVVGDNGNNWAGTDSDDIQAIDAKANVLAVGSLSQTWVESANMNYQTSIDKLANNINSVRGELVQDGVLGSSFEVGQIGGADLAEYYGASESLTPGQLSGSLCLSTLSLPARLKIVRQQLYPISLHQLLFRWPQ
jgi:hypothetical protein